MEGVELKTGIYQDALHGEVDEIKICRLVYQVNGAKKKERKGISPDAS